MEIILFAALGFACILAALLTITSPSPVASALYLVVTLFCLAGFYVLLAAPFVAAIQIIVYAGAVIVLILFVIMLLNLKPIDEHLPVPMKFAGMGIAGIILVITLLSIIGAHTSIPSGSEITEDFGKVGAVGNLLFARYLYAFEVVSVLLLLAVIGSVALIRKPDGEETHAH
jgi:NADH-quinone oxidoreductase subunit J